MPLEVAEQPLMVEFTKVAKLRAAPLSEASVLMEGTKDMPPPIAAPRPATLTVQPTTCELYKVMLELYSVKPTWTAKPPPRLGVPALLIQQPLTFVFISVVLA